MLTIDDRRTRDMDDAVEVSSSDTGWTVRVSIADVAKKVRRGSDLDYTAHERGATQYFAAGNSPMLPRDLAEWSLSLFPGRTRNTLNVEIELSPTLEVLSKKVAIGVVVSKAKLSYAEIPEIIAKDDHPHHVEIVAAQTVALGLLTRRQNAGALIFYDLNKGWVTNEDGTVKKMKKREDTIGYIIIQELMVLTNVVMAAYMAENQIPTLFRNHEPLNADPGRQALMEEIRALTNAPILDLESLQKRGNGLFKRAEYGALNVGHYGLNEKAYVHFTSPIRRYADLVVHQQLRAHLKGKKLPYTQEEIAATAIHLNALNQEQRERTKQIFTNRAEDQAWDNIEARKLDGLSPKDFERAVKVELRSGDSPSDAMVEAWTHRLDGDDLPVLCMTEALMLIGGADGWDTIREATVEALEDRPANAIAVLNQAQTLGWHQVVFEVSQSGPPHAPTFTAKAQLSVDALDTIYEATVTCPSGGSSKLVKQRAAVELLRNIVTLKDDNMSFVTITGTTPPPPAKAKQVTVDPNKNPISALMELSQGRKLPPPTFDFKMAGPPHAPVVTCTAKFSGLEAQVAAASKQDAKTAAAQALLEKVL